MKTNLKNLSKFLLIATLLLNSSKIRAQTNQNLFNLIVSGDCFSILKFDSANYFVTTRTSVLKSNSINGTWTNANWPLGIVRDNTSIVGSIIKQGSRFWVASLDNGNYYSSDLGNTFTSTGLTGFGCATPEMISLSNNDCLMSMGGFQRGIYKISPTSNTWTNKITLPADFADFTIDNIGSVYSTAYSPNHVGGLYKSSNNGDTWSSIWSTSYYNNPEVISVLNDTIFACTINGKIMKSSVNNTNFTLVSDQFGSIGFPNDFLIDNNGVFYITVNSSTDASAPAQSGLYISYDRGISWTRQQAANASNYYKINKIDSYIYIGTNSGLMRLNSTNSNCPNTNNITADGPTTFCAGNYVNLTNDVVGGTYQWKKSGVNISTNGTSRTYKATATGSYTCVATCNGNALTSNVIQVTTQTNAAVTLSATGATSFCAGDSVTLNATNLGSGYSVQWYRTNISMQGATNYSIVVKQPGTYKTVTKNLSNGCSRISSGSIITAVNCRMSNPDIIAVDPVSDEIPATKLGNSTETTMHLFPNPNAGSFTLEYDGIEADFEVQVVNTMGQVIYNDIIPSNDKHLKTTINLGDNMQKGVYVVRIINGENVQESKVMLQ